MSTLFGMNEILDTVIHGDALAVLKTLPNECVDAIVCDPPAGISFMNKEFDHDKGGRTQWVAWLSEIMREARRCLRPGGHALVWALPRTSHWTALALEDAGFEIRDNIYNLVSGDTILYNFIQSLSEEQQHAFMQVLDAQREPSGILHIFGSGFPKSANISAMIDKLLGKEREVIGLRTYADGTKGHWSPSSTTYAQDEWSKGKRPTVDTKPSSEEAQKYSGWHSALKPAVENWWLVRKPLAASSIAENVLQYGTGALNVDASRVGTSSTPRKDPRNGNLTNAHMEMRPWMQERIEQGLPLKGDFEGNQGRFPSHLLLTHTPSCIQVGTKRVQANGHDHIRHNSTGKMGYGSNSRPFDTQGYADEDGMETVTAWECPDFCPVRVLDLQSGHLHARGNRTPTKQGAFFASQDKSSFLGPVDPGSEGGASRYFQQLPALDDIPPYIYAGKASRRDRNEGLDDLPEKQGTHTVYLNNRRCRNCDKQQISGSPCQCPSPDWEIIPRSNNAQNTHPTVKSQNLMRYLVKLVTPPNGIVLDCFAVSGSTGVACIHEGFHFIGIEKEEEYVEIARKRIQHAMSASGMQQPTMPLAPSVSTTVRKTSKVHSSQLSLWDMGDLA